MWSIFGRRLSLYRCTYNAAEIGPGIVRKSWFNDNVKQTIAYKLRRCGKATVRPDSTISGSYDWLRLCQGATDRQCLLRSPAARIRRSISMRGRAITNDWRISMARAMVGIRATSGNDQRPMWISYCARRPPIVATDGMINRDGRRPMVRPIVATCDRSYEQSWHPTCAWLYEHSCGVLWPSVYDQSWHPTADRSINRGVQRSIARCYGWSFDR